tara:strand:- start:207 stop:455 length:249 start_codon:yes stop_codon:yes gene_type:complete
MPRPATSKNRFYHFQVILDGETKLLRTMVCVAKFLDLGVATIQRKLKNSDAILNKYKHKALVINRVKLPIFQREHVDVAINY